MGGVLIVARVISGLWWSGFRSLGRKLGEEGFGAGAGCGAG